jgi:nitrogen fixation-related uncharacterized protein
VETGIMKKSSGKYGIVVAILLGVLGWTIFWFSYDKKLSDEVKESSNSEVVQDLISEEKKGDVDKPDARPVKKGKYAKRVHLNFSVNTPVPKEDLYEQWENVIVDSGMYWADFIKTPREKHRAKVRPIEPKVLQLLGICSTDVVTNLSMKSDATWCKWAFSEDGGQVKVPRVQRFL